MDRQNYLARKTFNNTNTVNSKSSNSKSNFIPGNKKQNSFTTKQKKK